MDQWMFTWQADMCHDVKIAITWCSLIFFWRPTRSIGIHSAQQIIAIGRHPLQGSQHSSPQNTEVFLRFPNWLSQNLRLRVDPKLQTVFALLLWQLLCTPRVVAIFPQLRVWKVPEPRFRNGKGLSLRNTCHHDKTRCSPFGKQLSKSWSARDSLPTPGWWCT